MSETRSEFLRAFPAAIGAAIDDAIRGGAVVVDLDPDIADFRRSPEVNLRRVSERLHELWRTAPSPGRVVWCLAGTNEHGLDAFEVPAVLGRELHIDVVHQAPADDRKRIVVVGTLREECLAVAFVLPEASSNETAERFFSALAGSSHQAAVVFVSADRATAIASSPPAAAAVRQYVAAGGSLGLRVTAAALSRALADPQAQVAVLAALCDRPIQQARFDAPPADAPVLDAFMRAAGLSCDTSQPVDDGAAPADAIARAAAYAGASPYRPQPFDLRMPWFHPDAAPWFELPAAPMTAGGLERWWAARRGPADDVLALLLDSTRMDGFYRASRIDPAWEERYPDYRIYNWPAPAPVSRVALLDGDEAPAEQALELLAAAGESVRDAGPRAHLVTADGLLDRARQEIAARYGISPTGAIDAQKEAHEYLSLVSHEAPLRLDYADFARFVATDLGDALELGAGYGVLAWALSLRSRRYTCVDLDRHTFRMLRRDLGQAGLVADIHRLPFGDGAFNSVVANNVLEHLYDPLAGLSEIRRLLRPGGRLFALLPFDALNSHHELPAHLWKLDEPGLRKALVAAGFEIARLEVVHLNRLGAVGAFPTCHGFAAMFEAVNPTPGIVVPAAATVRREAAVPPRLVGRQLPIVREAVRFERWQGRQVLTIDSDQTDIDEFVHFGASVSPVRAGTAWPVADRSVDLVYGFLTVPGDSLDASVREIDRVLKPGGMVSVTFYNSRSFHHHVKTLWYYGLACDLGELAGPQRLVDWFTDGLGFPKAYHQTPDSVRQAFGRLTIDSLTVRNLPTDHLPLVRFDEYPPEFWRWVESHLGFYLLLKAHK